MDKVSIYIPLAWPDESLKKVGLYSRRAKQAVREMERVLERRGQIPSEAWGPDPRRAQVAAKVSGIIQDAIGWGCAHFVPDDPVDILLWHGWYDLAEVEAMLRIEDQFVVDIPESETEKIWTERLTLGQLVDFLLRHAACIEAWPKHGEGALESQPSPRDAVIDELRTFVERHGGICHASIGPATDLRELLPRRVWEQFNRFVRARFEVPSLVRRRFLGILAPTPVWLLGTFVATLLLRDFLQWQISPWLTLSAVAAAVWAVVVCRCSWPAWPRRLGTAERIARRILKCRDRVLRDRNIF